MTSNVEQIYQNALLADAAYIDFDISKHLDNNGVINGTQETIDLFLERGFTLGQFEKFRQTYKIYTPEVGKPAHQQNTIDGFAATIFEERTTHKLTVAFRGTEPGGGTIPGADLLQDVILALGFSSTLGAVMQGGQIDGFLEGNGLNGDNGNPAAGFSSSVNFVGHSLGGHLTLMASYYYPGLLDQAYTFNGAGTAFLDSVYLDHVKPLLSSWVDQQVLNPEKISNYFAKPGIELTANDFPFMRTGQGARTGLFIEKQGSDLSMDNHSMRLLVDALSVHRILALLGGDLELEAYDAILWQAHNRLVEVRTYEGVPDASNPNIAAISLDLVMTHLATMLGGNFSGLNTVNAAETFYQSILTSEVAFTLKPLSGFNDPVTTATSDSSNAGVALRYTLLTGASFVVIPAATYTAGIFSASAPTLANALYQLDQFSEQFWADRVDFYNRLMNRNETDLNEQSGVYETISGISAGSGDKHYYDLFTQTQVEYGQEFIREMPAAIYLAPPLLRHNTAGWSVR